MGELARDVQQREITFWARWSQPHVLRDESACARSIGAYEIDLPATLQDNERGR